MFHSGIKFRTPKGSRLWFFAKRILHQQRQKRKSQLSSNLCPSYHPGGALNPPPPPSTSSIPPWPVDHQGSLINSSGGRSFLFAKIIIIVAIMTSWPPRLLNQLLLFNFSSSSSWSSSSWSPKPLKLSRLVGEWESPSICMLCRLEPFSESGRQHPQIMWKRKIKFLTCFNPPPPRQI